jgi:signal transduction histidine kinase
MEVTRAPLTETAIDDTVLYVDDDTSNLVVLQAACGQDFNVETVTSGSDALEFLARREVAVLLADQRMPGMTGVELFEVTAERYPDTVRVLITAFSDLSSAIDAINRGKIRRYLRKPWEPAELKAALREALDLYQTRRKLQQLERRMLETERTYALGVVAAGFAHEVRNPLASLTMNLDVAMLRLERLDASLRTGGLGDPSDDDGVAAVRQQLESAVQAVEQVRSITDGIDLSHRRSDSEAVADLRQVLDLTMTFVRSTLHRRARVETDLTDVPRVCGSPSKLGQVVTNLLVNAVQAMPDRPRDENVIRIELRSDDGSARLEVADNGSGIPDDMLPRVFDPFFTTKSQGGTGIGLAISKTIVEEAGGTIEVTSRVGEGTRFIVRLPVAPTDSS